MSTFRPFCEHLTMPHVVLSSDTKDPNQSLISAKMQLITVATCSLNRRSQWEALQPLYRGNKVAVQSGLSTWLGIKKSVQEISLGFRVAGQCLMLRIAANY